jgi:putative oxidoreductase
MIDNRTAPYGAFILRVSMGLLFLAHGGIKILVFGFAGTAQYFASFGLPDWLAYAIIVLEVFGGLALVLGIYARAVAIVFAIELLAAAAIVHASNGFLFINQGGGWEYPAFWAVALIALALLGDGAHAMRPTVSGPAQRA